MLKTLLSNGDITGILEGGGGETTSSAANSIGMFDSIIGHEKDMYGVLIRTAGIKEFLIIVVTALVLGIVLSLLYLKVTRKKPSANFAVSLLILPLVIASVVFLVGNNVAAAFSLAGIFSFTRFRSVAGSSKDLTFIFVSLAIGLACGTGFVAYGVSIAVSLCIILLVLDVIGFGEPKSVKKILRINIPESLSYDEVFDPIFAKYTTSAEINRVKTIDLGATFELTYKVEVKNGINEKEFIDELRTRNANMNIILRLDDRREGREM